MAIQAKPSILIPWAETGNKAAITESKLRQGWISEIPKAENENWSQNRQDTALMHIMQAGISVWDSLTPYTANKSYVQASNGNIYVAVTDNTGQDPVNTASWRLLIDKSSKLVNETRSISPGYGMAGGGNLAADRVLGLAVSGVSPGVYGSSGSVSQINVDVAGRIISAANQAINFKTPIRDSLNNYQYADTGFQVFPNGFIIQWRPFVATFNTSTLVTYPVPMDAVFHVVLTQMASNYTGLNESILTLDSFFPNACYVRNVWAGDATGAPQDVNGRIFVIGLLANYNP